MAAVPADRRHPHALAAALAERLSRPVDRDLLGSGDHDLLDAGGGSFDAFLGWFVVARASLIALTIAVRKVSTSAGATRSMIATASVSASIGYARRLTKYS